MATVSATLEVTFTANYAGSHRICWRIQGSGSPYDCSATISCVGGGTTCVGSIPVTVNTTSCDGPIIFEGYVQATCEALSSTSGRLVFTETFTPTVTCVRHEITCARTGIDTPGITFTSHGQGYLPADVFAINRDLSDPETLDATGFAVSGFGTGAITSISSLLSAGTGYVALEVLNITDAAGSLGTIRIDSVGGSGEVLTYTLTAPGSGYIGPFTFPGGSGVGADFEILPEGVDYQRDGAILGFTVASVGLYSIEPLYTVATLTGSGLDIGGRLPLEACAAYGAISSIGLDCAATPIELTDGQLDNGETWATCIAGGLVDPTPLNYDVVEAGCCIPEDTTGTACTDHHIVNTGGVPVNVTATLCDGTFTTIAAGALATTAVCAVVDGLVDPDQPIITITDLGTPCT